ncbi:hypothetical protein DFH11DRAFT_1705053 [Phellopilus nigrolimitatus]|nr:hypothetical protein DFH11DRAFT_1705053 [Phellopilus nigrolimitatus]
MLTEILLRNRLTQTSHSAHVLRRFVSWSSQKSRLNDGTLVVKHFPGPNAPRFAPTPMVFVGSTELERDGGAFLSLGDKLCSEASSRGFSCFQFDLPYKQAKEDTAKEIMDRFASHLKSHISSTENPFPPILYARQLGCLIAQIYVSSYPVSALILDSPPLSCETLSSWPGLLQRFPLPLPEFTFEPKFPVLVVEQQSSEGMLKNNRLVKEGADYTEVCENHSKRGEIPSRSHVIEQWIDELGF